MLIFGLGGNMRAGHGGFYIYLILLIIMGSAFAGSEPDPASFYQVRKAYLNVNNCNEVGKPVFYASTYLRVKRTAQDPVSYSVSSCDGESIDELQCDGNYRTTKLDQHINGGLEGYYYSARESISADNTPQCTFTALRRRVLPGKGGSLRYERTDWGVELSDYRFECTREMAQIYFEAHSMKCSTHIAIDAMKVPETP